jgi:hypothetical protein
MKTALLQYIEDIENGTCKGEEYYLELEKEQIIEAYTHGENLMDGGLYFEQTYTNQKPKGE